MTTGITIFGIDLFYILCGLAGVCALALLLIVVLLEVPHVYEGGKWKVP